MNKFKKILSVVLFGGMLLSFTACSNGNSDTGAATSDIESLPQSSITEDVSSNEETTANSSEEAVNSESTDNEAGGNYQAPADLTDDCLDFIFRIDDKIYSMPTPVSEFLDDGWEVSFKSESEVPADPYHISFVDLKKGEYTLRLTTRNFSDVAVALEDSMVVVISLNTMLDGDLDFELSGGITLGVSIDEVKPKLDIEKFEEYSDDSGILKYFYSGENENLSLLFMNNKLESILIEKKEF